LRTTRLYYQEIPQVSKESDNALQTSHLQTDRIDNRSTCSNQR